ncbi:MAG: DUF1704 domain-containing protein [Bdellovibrionales bacterium]|nr:DUF1704 domain-containing protein [Bdellovibrionales bacterium]
MPSELIRKADDTLYEHLYRFRIFDYLNPLNRLEEKDKFLTAWRNGETYHPVFEYKKLPASLGKIETSLKNLKFDQSALAKLYESTRDEYLSVIGLLRVRGKENFGEKVTEVYGAPKIDAIEKNQDIFKKESRFQRPLEIGIKALSETLRNKIREERIEGWEITEDPLCVDFAEADVSHHKIRLQTGLLISKKDMRRLRYRLIQVHLYRAQNGERQTYKIFGIGTAGAWATEEALAMNFEKTLSLADTDMIRVYAGKFWACALAPVHSFYGVFSKLETEFDLETAYTLTESVKRGLANTVQTGGWTRDHTCFIEQKKISNLSKEDLRLLYTGRISLQQLDLVRHMISKEELISPAFLPR